MDPIGSSSMVQGRRTSHQLLPPIATDFQQHAVPIVTAALSDSLSAQDNLVLGGARDQEQPSLTRGHSRGESSSSSTSASKTAAFFGSADSLAPVLPSTLAANQDGLTRHASSSSTSSWTHMGSGGVARRWDDFEGKPITPLPSPRILASDGRITDAGGESIEVPAPAVGYVKGENNHLSAASPFDAAFGRRRRAPSSTGSHVEETSIAAPEPAATIATRSERFGGREIEIRGVDGAGRGESIAQRQDLTPSGSLNGSLSNFDISISDDSIAHMTSLPSLPQNASMMMDVDPPTDSMRSSSSSILSPTRDNSLPQGHAAATSSSPPMRRGVSSTSNTSDKSSPASSSKTLNFFGASRSISSAPTTQSNPSTEKAEASTPRRPSETSVSNSAVYINSRQGQEAPPRSPARSNGPQSASLRSPASASSEKAGNHTSSAYKVLDSMTPLPSAIGDAPSLLPTQTHSVELHTPTPLPSSLNDGMSSAWTRDGRQDQGGRSSRSRGTSSTRHVHGPSENATGSSFLPSVEAVKSAGALFLREASTSPSSNKDQFSNAATPETSLGTAALRRESEKDDAAPAVQAAASIDSEAMEEEEDEGRGVVGPYKVERTLGVGAFSRVVLAARKASTPPPLLLASTNGSTKRPSVSKDIVALKMLERVPCMHNERLKVSWVREVEVLKHIAHPSIVRFISSFSTPKHHNLVLERVGGGELFELLASHSLELAKREWLVRRLFGELSNAVGWMHAINLVHRDIKLESKCFSFLFFPDCQKQISFAHCRDCLFPDILLTFDLFSTDLRPSSLGPGPLLKLTDFGLSRFIDPNSPSLETRCGSEEYAAPELIMGKRYDGRKTDTWAMGVVLYALLTGCLPFLEDTATTTSGVGREGQSGERDAKARKTHLLRIAKGDLRWPASGNDQSLDVSINDESTAGGFAPNNRLVTPAAKHMVGRFLRRDAAKRATAWEAWDEEWMVKGSFTSEASALGDTVTPPVDPRSTDGQRWLLEHARVHSGAAHIAHDD